MRIIRSKNNHNNDNHKKNITIIKYDKHKKNKIIISTIQINAYINLKYIESLSFLLLRINAIYIVLPVVFHFHGID